MDLVNQQIKKTREEILMELKSSQEKNTAIGIFLKDTNELVTTGVISIIETPEGDFTIVLREEDLHGFPVERNSISLANIDRVIHFSIGYDDPQYVKVRRKEKFKV